MIIRILAPGWAPTPEQAAVLLDSAPRIALADDGIWADARGLDPGAVADRLLSQVDALCGNAAARAGVAAVPVTAELAARCTAHAHPARIGVIAHGAERSFGDPLPVSEIVGTGALGQLLEGVGVLTCGAFAALEQEAVEVRFGAEAVRLWRLARADDPRRLFMHVGAAQPSASLDFIDYVVTDPERLIFTANALLGNVSETLVSRGEHARRMTLTLSLGNRQTWQRVLKPARATASRSTWLRLLRAVFEKLSVPDAVAGLGLEVDGTEAARAVQGDLFDSGFATASAVEGAIERIIEAEGEVIHRPVSSRHPLMEKRSAFVADSSFLPSAPSTPKVGTRGRGDAETGGPPRRSLSAGSRQQKRNGLVRETAEEAYPRVPASPRPRVQTGDIGKHEEPPQSGLTLQMLSDPERVIVETIRRRDHIVPIRYRDTRGWHQLVTAAGPDRVSGGRWNDAFAREYYRAVTVDGRLVCLYRDARHDDWFIHGWWD